MSMVAPPARASWYRMSPFFHSGAENDTSTVVSPTFDAQIDKFGYIELVRRQAE